MDYTYTNNSIECLKVKEKVKSRTKSRCMEAGTGELKGSHLLIIP